jgi:hypothetical protein
MGTFMNPEEEECLVGSLYQQTLVKTQKLESELQYTRM